jgi:hypothetical protein
MARFALVQQYAVAVLPAVSVMTERKVVAITQFAAPPP